MGAERGVLRNIGTEKSETSGRCNEKRPLG